MRDISIASATDREIMEALGDRLRALREARQESILEVAAATGLNRATVSRAEQGDNPTLLTIVRLLRAYGRLGALDSFIPVPEVSPMALLRRQQGQPKRRRGRAASAGDDG